MTVPLSTISSKSAVILAGGKGTRLGNLTKATPKPLLPVGGEPFVLYVIRNLVRYGITNIVLSVGYMADTFHSYFSRHSIKGATVRIVEEEKPLGTGGGVKISSQGINEPFFVLNGDTFFDCSFGSLYEVLANHSAYAAMFLRESMNSERYGAISLVDEKVVAFQEKLSSGPGLINSGVYLFTPDATAMLPADYSSLEGDLFPALAAAGKLVGILSRGYFLDIGLPETYSLAQTALPEWERRMRTPRQSD